MFISERLTIFEPTSQCIDWHVKSQLISSLQSKFDENLRECIALFWISFSVTSKEIWCKTGLQSRIVEHVIWYPLVIGFSFRISIVKASIWVNIWTNTQDNHKAASPRSRQQPQNPCFVDWYFPWQLLHFSRESDSVKGEQVFWRPVVI